jgi:hypothetical protein
MNIRVDYRESRMKYQGKAGGILIENPFQNITGSLPDWFKPVICNSRTLK